MSAHLVRWVIVAALAALIPPAGAAARLGMLRSASATGYCYPQRTAMGTWARWGVVAVPRGSWLYGRRIYVPGGVHVLGRQRTTFRAEDTIGANRELDIFIPPAFGASEPDCSFGRRVVRYRVVFP
jgi:hypothetical protein